MDHIVRGWNWFFEEFNLWRVLDECEPPTIEHALNGYTAPAGAMEVELPEEIKALKAMIKVINDDPRIRGMCGRRPPNFLTMTGYENLESYRAAGKPVGRIIRMKGLLSAVKPDKRQGLKRAGTSYELNTIVGYQDLYDGKKVHKFNFFTGETIVDGVRIDSDMAQNLRRGVGTII